MSTATIYADRSDEPGNPANDEATGVIGGEESHTPLYWEYSVRIARRWEEAQAEADLPATRRVALRTAMVMSPDPGGVFDVLLRLTRLGLGGPVAGGRQYVSWIHDADFVAAVTFLLENDLAGPVNLAAPDPVPQAELMARAPARLGWLGRAGRPAGHGRHGGPGRLGDAQRPRAAPQEPPGGPRPPPRRGLRLRPPDLARGG